MSTSNNLLSDNSDGITPVYQGDETDGQDWYNFVTSVNNVSAAQNSTSAPSNASTSASTTTPSSNLSTILNAPYEITAEADPSIIFQGGEAGAPDPFQLNPIYNTAAGGGAPTTETASPGYETYGQDWVNLVNALGNPTEAQNALDAASGAGASSSLEANQQAEYYLNYMNSIGIPLNQSLLASFPGGSLYQYNQQYPLSVNSDIYDTAETLTPSQASQIQTQVANALGIDPNSPDASTYAQAYITYVNQSQGRDDLTNSVNNAKTSDDFEHIVGDIGQAIGYAAAAAGPDIIISGGGALGAAAADAADTAGAAGATADAAADTGTAADAATEGGLSPASQSALFKAVSGVENAGGSLASKNPVGAALGLADAGGGFADLTAAANAPDVSSDNLVNPLDTDPTPEPSPIDPSADANNVANALNPSGQTAPVDLSGTTSSGASVAGSNAGGSGQPNSSVVGAIGKLAVPAATAALPPILQALGLGASNNASTTSASSTSSTAPASVSTPTITSITLTPDAPGSALAASPTLENSASSGFQPVTYQGNTGLGSKAGGSTLSEILGQLGLSS